MEMLVLCLAVSGCSDDCPLGSHDGAGTCVVDPAYDVAKSQSASQHWRSQSSDVYEISFALDATAKTVKGSGVVQFTPQSGKPTAAADHRISGKAAYEAAK